jgi:transposase, IS5 family
MSRMRFRQTDEGSFFGEVVYQRAVPQEHFLRKLRELLPWEALTQQWVALYKGGAEYGPPPYHPALVLKMLFLAYLYNLSERQVEVFVNDSLSAKYFLGLAADEPCPDSTTLTVFKGRLLKAKGQAPLEGLLAKVLRLAQRQGIAFGRIQVVDSAHTIANVNVGKEQGRQKEGKPPRDPHARWGTKGRRRKPSPSGPGEERPHYFFGYKAHVSLNAETHLITSLTVTHGGAYDGHQLPELVRRDRAQGVGAQVYAGDRGYDDGENHFFLAQQGLRSALKLNSYRTQKRDPNKEGWLALKEDPDYQAGLRERYKVEQKFGEAKAFHGLRRCRYLGLARYRLQAYLTALALNLKRLVKLLYGLGFRQPPRGVLQAA